MSKKIAFLFPGQGSQSVGMGKDLYENYECAKNVFDTADSTLGKNISKICLLKKVLAMNWLQNFAMCC